jgi:hypothetical protein
MSGKLYILLDPLQIVYVKGTPMPSDSMANDEQLKVLRQGTSAWNKWRKGKPKAKVDLQGADLRGGRPP